uniref:Uncharacterized protein n=1 Tax=Octopus bimaculoides TaxID=37653 RepID=A0A0L8H4Y3_OCTBM
MYIDTHTPAYKYICSQKMSVKLRKDLRNNPIDFFFFFFFFFPSQSFCPISKMSSHSLYSRLVGYFDFRPNLKMGEPDDTSDC